MAQSLTKTAYIDRTPEQIWDWLNDWDHIRAWMGPTLVSIEIFSGEPDGTPIQQGMRFRETRKMGKMTAKAVIDVERHEIDPQGVFHHVAVFDDGCNRMVSEYQYEPDGTGTRATWTMRNAPGKWWTKLLAPIFGPMMIKMCEKHEGDHLDRLKALIETPE